MHHSLAGVVVGGGVVAVAIAIAAIVTVAVAADVTLRSHVHV